jgi:hypothetical protein
MIARFLVGVLLLSGCASTPGSEPGASSEWVRYGADGRLVYRTTASGDRIMDFSHAGYMGGGVALPDVPVMRTVAPSGGGDDTRAIQAAIDEVSALPLRGGFRGAVLLAPGTFRVSEPITISSSGVVLRGSGSGAGGAGDRSTLSMTGEPHVAVVIRRGGQGDGDEPVVLAETVLADPYVPSGTASFRVADASGFARGDRVLIRRPVTQAWIEFMEMDDLVRDGRPQTWLQAGTTIDTEREVAAVVGNTITLDVPLADSYDARHLDPPGTKVVKIRPPERVARSGVEYLHIAAPPMAISHTQPHFSALRMNGEDLWARDLRIEETMNSVGVGGRRITVERVHVTREAPSQGSSRPAKFAPNGTQILLDRVSVQADNIWFIATGARHAGPIVVLNADFRGDGRAESHQRWSTGMLYDNVHVPEGGIEFRNRGSMGSGHGWSMGWGVAWNSVAESFLIQHPPGAPNWLIGGIGEIRASARPFDSSLELPNGIVDSHGRPVQPRSLYLAQLRERLGPEAVRNIGYN